MKVPASLRSLYDDQKASNERLREVVDARMRRLKDPKWHYESRVKELVSYALKVESGRVLTPEALEDYFACTIVVANAIDVAVAEARISEVFNVKERRPRRADETHKRPESFPFDDLRLYVAIEDDPAEVREDLIGIVFEVQIKTFLQHAWAIATHDLVYKTDEASWSRARIAYQIKAMLEHAEVSIQEAEKLSSSDGLAKVEARTRVIQQGIELLKAQWEPDELPRDLRRLASNVVDILKALKMTVAELADVLDRGRAERGGYHPVNLSPHGIVIQYLLDAEKDKVLGLLRGNERRPKILLPREIVLPGDAEESELRNAVFLGEATP